MTRATALALACALAGGSACGVDEEGLAVETGERITVRYDASFQLCAGTLRNYDRWIEASAEQLGLDPDALAPMTFNWPADERYREVSGRHEDKGGWAYGDEAFARSPLLRHEVGHMLAANVATRSNRFLEEGLATALDHTLLRLDPSADPRRYLTIDYDDLNYAAAGAFVTFLLSRFGPDPFWELYRDVGRGASEACLRRRFARIYGRELDDIVDAYLSGDTRPEDRPLPPASCLGDEIPWAQGDLWVYARTIACEDDDVVGGLGQLDELELSVTFVIAEPGEHSIHAATQRITPLLRSCDGPPWLTSERLLTDEPVFLEAGRHSIRFVGRASAPGLAAVAIQRATP